MIIHITEPELNVAQFKKSISNKDGVYVSILPNWAWITEEIHKMTCQVSQ